MGITELKISEMIQYREHQIASKSLTRKLGIELPFMVYAMDAGESISNEQSTLTRLLQVIDGILTVQVGTVRYQVPAGEMMVVPANTLHELRADQRCQFMQFETK